jgi:hypothetical protein
MELFFVVLWNDMAEKKRLTVRKKYVDDEG